MLTYKAIVIAAVASTAFAVHAAEFPLNVESGPQPAPYGVKDPVPTPANFKFAVFPLNVESGPQPAPYGVKDPVPTPANFKFAEIPAHGGPECNPQSYGITDRVRGS